MASASNDGSVHIFHFKVDNQTLTDAVILPLKVLKGHNKVGGEGVKDIKFHPKQPWIFTSGTDKKVLLWMWFKLFNCFNHFPLLSHLYICLMLF